MTTQLTTAKTTIVAATPGEISPWREAANEDAGASFGTLLKFVKGDWLLGEDRTELSPGTMLVACMDEYWRGWTKWEHSKPIDHVIGRVVDRFRVPTRNELDELDRANQEGDPWQRCVYLVMRRFDNADDIFTFASTSDGGVKAVGKLSDRYDRLRHKHPAQVPVVKIGGGTYFSKKNHTDVAYPTFTLVGWDYWDSEAKEDPASTLQVQHAREMDDAIPF